MTLTRTDSRSSSSRRPSAMPMNFNVVNHYNNKTYTVDISIPLDGDTVIDSSQKSAIHKALKTNIQRVADRIFATQEFKNAKQITTDLFSIDYFDIHTIVHRTIDQTLRVTQASNQILYNSLEGLKDIIQLRNLHSASSPSSLGLTPTPILPSTTVATFEDVCDSNTPLFPPISKKPLANKVARNRRRKGLSIQIPKRKSPSPISELASPFSDESSDVSTSRGIDTTHIPFSTLLKLFKEREALDALTTSPSEKGVSPTILHAKTSPASLAKSSEESSSDDSSEIDSPTSEMDIDSESMHYLFGSSEDEVFATPHSNTLVVSIAAPAHDSSADDDSQLVSPKDAHKKESGSTHNLFKSSEVEEDLFAPIAKVKTPQAVETPKSIPKPDRDQAQPSLTTSTNTVAVSKKDKTSSFEEDTITALAKDKTKADLEMLALRKKTALPKDEYGVSIGHAQKPLYPLDHQIIKNTSLIPYFGTNSKHFTNYHKITPATRHLFKPRMVYINGKECCLMLTDKQYYSQPERIFPSHGDLVLLD